MSIASGIRLAFGPAWRKTGFNAARAGFLHTIAAPDKLIFLGYRGFGTPWLPFCQTDDMTVFSGIAPDAFPRRADCADDAQSERPGEFRRQGPCAGVGGHLINACGAQRSAC